MPSAQKQSTKFNSAQMIPSRESTGNTQHILGNLLTASELQRYFKSVGADTRKGNIMEKWGKYKNGAIGEDKG